MEIEELGLAPGDGLQLQIGENAEYRYPVKFIGIRPKGSVIVSAPSTGKDKMIFIREGSQVTLRFVAKNTASGFTSRVIATRGQPYPYVHLEIPQNIQSVEVRKEVRVATDIPVTVINKTKQSAALTGRLLNMSCSGVRIESKQSIAAQGDILNITMKLKIHEIERLATVDCLVTYVKEDETNHIYAYGMNFNEVDDDEMLSLRGYVYQEILKGLHMI